MKNLLIEYPKCSTCQKACKFLEERNETFEKRHIVASCPTESEIKKWYLKSNLPLKRFFNTSGLVYKELGLKDKLSTMTEEEQIKLLASNGMLVKRPIYISGDMVLVGFREAEWKERIK